MGPHKVAVVIGSNRQDSINRKLALALIKLAPPSLACNVVRIDDLPVFNQDHDQNPVEAVRRLKREVAASDGVLFVTPEHNRSVPTVLKNALDWGSRPYGQNAWAGKPAGLIGASIGSVGTAVVQQHLRGVLGYLDMPTLGQPEAYVHFREGMIDADGNVASDHTTKYLQTYVDCYAAWVARFAR